MKRRIEDRHVRNVRQCGACRCDRLERRYVVERGEIHERLQPAHELVVDERRLAQLSAGT